MSKSKFPKELYVKYEETSILLAAKSPEGLAVHVGEHFHVGVYKLVREERIEGIVHRKKVS